jgi:aryl-phospho-beta-D-glucosidase BglC (GH1 family)
MHWESRVNRFKIFIIVLGALFLFACNSDSSSDSALDKSIEALNDPDKKEQDVTPPVISLNGAARVEINQGETYTDAGATAMDNVDGELTNKIQITNPVNTANVDTYTITYSVTDAAGNTSTATRTVIVKEVIEPENDPDKKEQDVTPPVISLNGEATVEINQGEAYTDGGASAMDNVDGELTNKIQITNPVNTANVDTYTITYSVTDAAGNTSTATRTVIVKDVTAPEISLNGEVTVEINQGETYTDAGASAMDNVDGELTNKIQITNPVNTANVDTYTITYSVTDAAGNTSTATRTVIVKDVTEPEDTGIDTEPEVLPLVWNFETDHQAWQVTSGNAVLSLVNNGFESSQAIAISSRQNAYEGLGVELTDQLGPDQTYVVRAWVKKSFTSTDAISLNLQVGEWDQQPKYQQLNRVVVEDDQWHLIRGFIRLTPQQASRYLRLYINTDSELGGFIIDSVTLNQAVPLTDSLPPLDLHGAQLKQGEVNFRLQSINLIAYQDYINVGDISPDNFMLDDFFKQTYAQFDQDDFQRIKNLGFNAVRLALDGRWFEDIHQPSIYLESGFAWLDFVLSWAEQAGIYVILDMHAPIGGGNQGPEEVHEFWDEPTNDNNDYRSRLIALWQEITTRYKNRSVIAAFDVLNEPKPYYQEQYEDWLNDLIPAIAAIDPDRLLIVENTFADDMTLIVRDESNVIHDYHFYDPWDAYTNNLAAVWAEGDLNLERIRADFSRLISAYQGKAVHIGEFGQEYATYVAKNAEAWLNDVKTVMDENGFHYSYFSYKGNVFGLYASEQRFAVNATVNQALADWLIDANSRLFEAPQTEDTPSETTEPEPPVTFNPPSDSVLSYLNYLREYTGLTPYISNTILDTAAMGHTDYQLNENVMGHDQTRTTSIWFTGAKPSDRAKAAGYNSWAVSENISFNKDTANELIDDLMTAIYHRMSLLDFERDEIGFGFKVQPVPDKKNDSVWGVLTTKSGLMALETLCTAGETITSGSYYTCPNNNRVSVESYNLALVNVRANSNEFIVWPAPGAIVPPVFYEESPDPLPNCSVSGNPISVQINPKNLADYTLLADSFVLKDSQGQAVEILTTLTNETAQPDIAAASWQTDDKKWLSAFPAERLAWGETYTASLNYEYGGVSETWQWSFSTQSLPQTPMHLNADTSKTMQQNEVLYVYVPPQDCSVSQNGWATSSYGDNPQVSVEAIDSQTYKIQASSLSELKIEFRQQGNSLNTRNLTLTYD